MKTPEELREYRRNYYREYYQRNKEKSKAAIKRWQAKNKDKLKKYRQEYEKRPEVKEKKKIREKLYREKNKKKALARKIASSFKYTIKECQNCGSKENLEKHHPNYDDPLWVLILCRKCHHAYHNGKIKLKKHKPPFVPGDSMYPKLEIILARKFSSYKVGEGWIV